MAEAPASNFVTAFEDSRRWRHIQRRPGDIVISTPPKSGTTWMQGIVAALLWPDGEPPESRTEVSPWIDVCVTPIESLVAQVEAQQHRRFMKTHSPGDCIPFDDRCRYIVVYRDGRDSLVSWGNHRSKMRPELVQVLMAGARDRGAEPVALTWDGDFDTLIPEWEAMCSPVRHLASWWPRRHASNVFFTHYNDLTRDLPGEMKRLASFLALPISDDQWPAVVERCGLGAMRARAESRGGMDHIFEGGAASFFYKGTNGRWRAELSDAQLAGYADLVRHGLPPEAAAWLEHGSLELGVRPSDVGAAPAPLATASGNPMASRIRRHTGNSVHAISERKVDDARDQGFFDNLPLHGKPIPDLDRPRRDGWWAQRFVKTERYKVKALQLEDDVRKAMPALWRLESSELVRERVEELNREIRRYNSATSLTPMSELDLAGTLATWRDLRKR